MPLTSNASSSDAETLYTTEFFARQSPGALRSALQIVPVIFEVVRPASVVDFGCGVGAWLSAFDRHGVRIYGLDSSDVPVENLLIDPHQFRQVDLSKPVQLSERFHLALCLEVAEHLPESSADILVRSLTAAAPVVVFSAAIPFQSGTGHLNEQWPAYWASKFERFGFVPLDVLRYRFWTNQLVERWYAQNMLLYVERSYLPQLGTGDKPVAGAMALVHPDAYIQVADPNRYSVRHAFKLLVRALRNASRRRLLGG